MSNIEEDQSAQMVRMLAEALPFFQRYTGQTFVIKYGGHALGDGSAAGDFARDVVLLRQVGIRPVIVHGGGPQIGEMLGKLGHATHFIDGLRVTDAAAMKTVEMVLVQINQQIVREITAAGGLAVGVSGSDARSIEVEKISREDGRDLGRVGEPVRINPVMFNALEDAGLIPVVSPIGLGADGEPYNVNADRVAGALAGALRAARLLMLTDVAGVLDKSRKLIAHMNLSEAKARLQDGTAQGGMIPKLQTCIEAVEAGAKGAVILDGRVPHALLREVFTQTGIGTLIEAGQSKAA